MTFSALAHPHWLSLPDVAKSAMGSAIEYIFIDEGRDQLPALVYQDKHYPFKALGRMSLCLAELLNQRCGDKRLSGPHTHFSDPYRIAFMMPASPGLFAFVGAALACGVLCVIIDPDQLTEKRQEVYLRQ